MDVRRSHPARSDARPPDTLLPSLRSLLRPTVPLLFLLAPGVVTACEELEVPGDEHAHAGIALDVSEVSLDDGETLPVRAYTVDPDGEKMEELDGSELDWSSSAPDMVSVHDGILTGERPGEATVEARDPAGHRARVEVAVQPVPATAEAVAGREQEGRAGEQAEEALEVRLRDRHGDPVPGREVAFTVVSGGGSLDPAAVATDDEGIARSIWTLGGETGIQHAKAEVAGSPVANVDFLAEVGAGAVHELALRPDRSPIQLEPADSVHLQVEARDRYGNPVDEVSTPVWTSVDTLVATVRESGVVVAHEVGTTTVTVTVGNLAADAVVEVVEDSGESGEGAAEPDSPGKVTDLAVVAATDTSVVLEWTEVDDGTGNPAHYGVRWHAHPVGSNWGSATHVEAGSCASPVEGARVGSTRTCTAEGLEPGRTLDFQMVSYRGEVKDGEKEVEEFGELSNVATGVTSGAEGSVDVASVAVTPRELSFTALEGQKPLTAAASDSSGDELDGVAFAWESTDPEIASVDDMGQVTSKGTGTAVIVATALCCNVADSSAVTVTQEVSEAFVEPAFLELTEGESETLSASAYDANGIAVEDASSEWSVDDERVAAVGSDGRVTGVGEGTTRVQATFDGVTASAQVEVHPETRGSADRPNEPSGLQPWFEHDWQTFPESSEIGFPMAASGTGYFHGAGNFGGFHNVELINDPGADHGFGKSLRVTLPDGHPFGTGVFNWSLTSSPQSLTHHDHTDLREIYLSLWIYFEANPSDGTWEIPNAAWRTFSLNRHVGHNCEGGAALGFSQRGSRGYQSSFQNWWFWGNPDCDTGGGAGTVQGVSPGAELDTWYHVEIHLERLDVGGSWPADGESRLRFWMNGEQLVDRTVTHAWPSPIRQVHMNLNPSGSWHDGAREKTRDDHFRISGIYVSGTPY